MAPPYDDLPDGSDTWTTDDVARLWAFLRTLWQYLPVVPGEESAAARTWQAMFDGITPWEAGRAAWRMSEDGADRCPVVGVLAAAARRQIDDRSLRHPPPLTADQQKIRDFLAGLLGPRDSFALAEGAYEFLLQRRFLDDYAAGRMSLCATIHAQLDDAGLLPDHWRSPV
jgi:hypothetical protein